MYKKVLATSLGLILGSGLYAADDGKCFPDTNGINIICPPTINITNTKQSDTDNTLDDDIRLVGTNKVGSKTQNIYSIRINGGQFISTYLNGPFSATPGYQANGVFYYIEYEYKDDKKYKWAKYDGSDDKDYRIYPVTGLEYKHASFKTPNYYNGYIKPRPFSTQIVLDSTVKKIRIVEAISDFGVDKKGSDIPKVSASATSEEIELPTWKTASDKNKSFNTENYTVTVTDYDSKNTGELTSYYANGVYAFPIVVKIKDTGDDGTSAYLNPYSNSSDTPNGISGEDVFSHLSFYNYGGTDIYEGVNIDPDLLKVNNIFSNKKTVIVPADLLSDKRDSPADQAVNPIYSALESGGIKPYANGGKVFLVYTTDSKNQPFQNFKAYLIGQNQIQSVGSAFDGTVNLKDSYSSTHVSPSCKGGEVTYTLEDSNNETASNNKFINVTTPNEDAWEPIDYIVDNWGKTAYVQGDPESQTNIDDLSANRSSDYPGDVSHKPDNAPRGIYYGNLQSGILACHPYKNTQFCTQHVPYDYSTNYGPLGKNKGEIFLSNGAAGEVTVDRDTVKYKQDIDHDDDKRTVVINGSRDLYIYDNTGRLHYVAQ